MSDLSQGPPAHLDPPGQAARESAPVLVVDFGAQYAQLIARRVREARIYSQVVPHTLSVGEMLDRKPGAIILSGGPSSVYAPGAPSIDPALLRAGVPVFGICYGFQAMVAALRGTVDRNQVEESGRTRATIDPGSVLFAGQPVTQSVWMSHRDAVVKLPDGFRTTASTSSSAVAAFENDDGSLCGVQWHPEVVHTAHGQQVLERFLYQCAGIPPTWTTNNIIEDSIKAIAVQVGTGHVLCGLSGGVDSAVAAALVHKAVGDRLTCVFIDHGLLRQGEREQVLHDFADATGITVKPFDARQTFLEKLAGQIDPEEKRRIIGREFIRAFEKAAMNVITTEGHSGPIEYLVQGTLYPDVVESGGGTGTQIIKSHHNVGGLPSDLTFKLVEPLKDLFKDEVRTVGLELGLPEEIVWRHPFPGPGLAIRIIGEVTEERLDILRQADAIAREELTIAGLDRQVWQFPVILLADVRSVGVQGDVRTYGYPVVLRPVTSDDAMTADWARLPVDVLEQISTRITNEVDQVNRVVVDITSKPPGTIEWE
jgi:GMP synthase (glutamine-hydrolysing)